MIDIHSHILPGVDDGPADQDTALAMARMAVKDGITTMIATPHVEGPALAAQDIHDHVSRFNTLLQENDIRLNVVAGAEVAYHADLASLSGYCLHHGPFVLIELPHSHIPKGAGEFLYELKIKGYQPIIAHPERNRDVLTDPQLLLDLLDPHISIQLTAESVTGELGPHIQQCAHYLLRRQAVHFLASDAHGLKNRKPLLAKARKIAAKIIGKKAAAKLVEDNPAAVLNGKPLSFS